MPQLPEDDATIGRRYALCVGIGTYTTLTNRNLRYAVEDAKAVAERLQDPQRGSFEVTLLTEATETTEDQLRKDLNRMVNAYDRKPEDLVVIYFSCHGGVYRDENNFYLQPSDTRMDPDGEPDKNTVIDIYDLAKRLSGARVKNIIFLLDVCHSGGAGAIFQHLRFDLRPDTNLFIIGAARQDQVAMQSSQLQHGIFTHCLLRAFEQPPTKDGWLTVSQIQSFVSDEIHWFAKDHPIQIQGWSVTINPNLPLLRNPAYPELCPLPPLWNVPLQRNSFFTGQEDLLVRLATILHSDQKTALTQPQAIAGLGGIGKTQLALEYAYRHRQDYHAVLWSRADTREALISTFVTIAHLLDLPQKDEQDQMITVEAVKAWLAGRSKWLLILDNADELAMVKEFIPLAFQGHLLLTTRAQVMGGLARKIEVEAMRPETGALLLLRRAGLLAPDTPLEQTSPADVIVAKELSKEMGGLPLALDQAGAYIEEVPCSPQDYQQLYQTRRTELLKGRGGVAPDYPESVATTWSLAFQKVERGNPAASDLLRLCAFLHPDAIPEEMIAKGAQHLGPQLQATASDPLALNKAITALRAYSLLNRDATNKTLSIHRLVQAVLREDMNEKTARQWMKRVVEAVSEVFPEVQPETWTHCERLLPHALVCIAFIKQENMTFPKTAAFLQRVGWYLEVRARYAEAEPLLQRALVMRNQEEPPKLLDIVQCLRYLGEIYYYLGRYPQSEQHYQEALTLCKQAFGTEHPATAQSLNDLGAFYYTQGKYDQAEPLLTQALTLREHILGPEHVEVSETLNNLAMLYNAQGKYDQAEPLLRRAVEIRERTLGPDHPEVTRFLNNLAFLYNDQGKYDQAEPLLRRALDTYERTLGPDHPDVARALIGLAQLYTDQRKYDQAEPLLRRALTIREQKLGAEHPEVAESLNDLAVLYNKQEKYKQAEPLLTQALVMRRQAFGPEHPGIAECLSNLAVSYHGKKEYPQAEDLFKQALTMREQTLGPNAPQLAYTLRGLANLYVDQDRYRDAEPLYQRALKIQEHLSPNHPEVATSLESYALLLRKLGRGLEADILEERARGIRLQPSR